MATVQTAGTMAAVWVLVTTTLLTLHRATAAPIVDAPWGRIQGLDSVSVSGLNYSSYLAIPFALPPVGELRFAKPVAHPGYGEGRVFNATFPGTQCLQVYDPTYGVGMSEDCLTLNVFVPVSPSNGPKTVMVWIHGGGFKVGGAASYTPSELVTDHDVIVVVIQYRLGALGFLSTGDDLAPGNMGLWDQNLALRWVKTNIGAFGGDPEFLTIFGQSAGAASVGYHVISPASKEVTFRAIQQSGTPLAPWAINKNPGRGFDALANHTNCLVSSWTDRINYYFNAEALKRAERERALACLRRLDTAVFTRPDEELTFGGLAAWVPVVDGDFIPRPPAELMSDVAYLDAIGATERDVMISINNNEGAPLVRSGSSSATKTGEEKLQTGSEDQRNLLVTHLTFLYGDDLLKEPQSLDTLVSVLQFSYTQWSGTAAGTVSGQDVVDVYSDTNFVLATVEFARALANAKAKLSGFRSPLGSHYLYLFNYYPTYKAGVLEYQGSSHAEDLLYEFDNVAELGGRVGFSSNEYTIAANFRTMLATFAKTGQPQVPLFNSQTGGVTVWPEFTLTEENYLSFELVPRVDDHLFGQRMALWTDLVPSLYNSTRVPEPTRYWTWQQQQQQLRSCNSPKGQQVASSMAKTFTFKGRLTFYKLH